MGRRGVLDDALVQEGFHFLLKRWFEVNGHRVNLELDSVSGGQGDVVLYAAGTSWEIGESVMKLTHKLV